MMRMVYRIMMKLMSAISFHVVISDDSFCPHLYGRTFHTTKAEDTLGTVSQGQFVI